MPRAPASGRGCAADSVSNGSVGRVGTSVVSRGRAATRGRAAGRGRGRSGDIPSPVPGYDPTVSHGRAPSTVRGRGRAVSAGRGAGRGRGRVASLGCGAGRGRGVAASTGRAPGRGRGRVAGRHEASTSPHAPIRPRYVPCAPPGLAPPKRKWDGWFPIVSPAEAAANRKNRRFL